MYCLFYRFLLFQCFLRIPSSLGYFLSTPPPYHLWISIPNLCFLYIFQPTTPSVLIKTRLDLCLKQKKLILLSYPPFSLREITGIALIAMTNLCLRLCFSQLCLVFLYLLQGSVQPHLCSSLCRLLMFLSSLHSFQFLKQYTVLHKYHGN